MKKHTTAIILAAGIGSRMESKIPKQYLELEGYPVLYHTLKAFQDSPVIDEIILVTGENELEYCKKEMVEKYSISKVTATTVGGCERYQSVQKGLEKISTKSQYIMIHDGARPILSQALINYGYESMQTSKAAIPALPVKDTIKKLSVTGEVMETPNRSELYLVQTPQVFEANLIQDAYEKLNQIKNIKSIPDITDDAMVVEYFLKYKVNTFLGDYKNIKITTPEDLELASLYLKKISHDL